MPIESPHPAAASRKPDFHTTRWSIVLTAGQRENGDSSAALAELCSIYWYPLYAFTRREIGDATRAQDLTQAFFVHLLEKQTIAKADPNRGRFRAFLLTAMKHFLANEWHKENAQKRGGGRACLSLDLTAGETRYQVDPSHALTPERLFERRWVLTLIDQVLNRLRCELIETGKADHFEQLKGSLTSEITGGELVAAAKALGITPAAAKQAAYRMRKHYRQMFREEVARTVDNEAEVDDEISRLLAILGD